MTNEQLVLRIKNGDDVADNMLALWEQVKNYVYKIALRYNNIYHAEIEDLMQEGYIAISEAVEHFEVGNGSGFINYATWWLKCRFNRYLNIGLVKIPEHIMEKYNKYRGFISDYQTKYSCMPSDSQISEFLQCNDKTLDLVKKIENMRKLASINSKVQGEDGEIEIAELLPSDVNIEDETIDKMINNEVSKILIEVVNTLPDEQLQFAEHKYYQDKPKSEIMAELKLNHQQYNSLMTRVRNSLRRTRRKRDIEQLIPERFQSGIYVRGTEWNSTTERIAIKLYENC